MTVVAAINSEFSAVLIADSRLTWQGGPPARDICRKLVVPNDWSIIGFAGDLCLARHITYWLAWRLRKTPRHIPEWLRSDQEIRHFVREAVRGHVRQVADHKPCQKRYVALMLVWVDHTRSLLPGVAGPEDPNFVPPTEVIVIETPSMVLRRIGMGCAIIGSGSVIEPHLSQEQLWNIMAFGQGTRYGDAQRCYLAAELVRGWIETEGVTTVGGLYQLASVSGPGAVLIPYFYWAAVETGYGTYVAMRIEKGEWVQGHRPSGVRVRVVSPWEIQLGGPEWQPGRYEMFDPKGMLTRDSPGVLPQTPHTRAFWIYDPNHVPDELRASWGDDPLPPLSWRRD